MNTNAPRSQEIKPTVPELPACWPLQRRRDRRRDDDRVRHLHQPAKVAKDVGTPELMMAVWIVAASLSFFGALSLAELGAAFSQAGGIYIYLREAYGSLIAFVFGWTMFLVVEAGTLATLAVGFSTKYLPYFVKLSGLQGKVVAAALILILAMVNYTGVKKGRFRDELPNEY